MHNIGINQAKSVQKVRARINGEFQVLELPNEEAEVMPGIRWGLAGEVFSPAFWAALAWMTPDVTKGFVDCGGTLVEEVAFCLLGGYGITAEVARAAFTRLREVGVLRKSYCPTAAEIEDLLIKPLDVYGRPIRYRFPRQRSERISKAIYELSDDPPGEADHRAFRDRLMQLPGVGPKTASWITRNWLASDVVAILDVHVVRAGRLIGLFRMPFQLPRDYSRLEWRFLDFARCLGVRAGTLDALIWKEMRQISWRQIRSAA